MKIAFIGQKGIPAKFGGVETHVENLTKELASRGNDVFVYSRRNYTKKNQKIFHGVNIINLPSIPTKHLDAITHTFLSIIHASFQNYDVIHFQSIGPSTLVPLAKLLNPNSLVVATYHSQDYFHAKWGAFAKAYLRLGEWMICHIPDKTISTSKTLKKIIRDKFSKEVAYIPNGAAVVPVKSDEKIKKWGLEKNNFIVSISRLIRHKGLHYLIEAFQELHKNKITQGKKLVIVGGGYYTDDYVKELKDLAKGNPDIIFTGNQTGETLKQLYSNNFTFVQPSESEGLSLALLEAMRYGNAMLTSNIPENIEAIQDTGLTFKNKDTNDLKDKLKYLIRNPEIAKELGRSAQKRAVDVYDWKKIAAQTEELYKSLGFEKKLKVLKHS